MRSYSLVVLFLIFNSNLSTGQITRIKKFLTSDTLTVEFTHVERNETKNKIEKRYYFEDLICFEADSCWLGHPTSKHPYWIKKVEGKTILYLPIELYGFPHMEGFFEIDFLNNNKSCKLIELSWPEDNPVEPDSIFCLENLKTLGRKELDFAILKVKPKPYRDIQLKKYNKTSWATKKIGSFNLQMPSWLKYKRLLGIDSDVGAYEGRGVTLSYDYGYYTNPGLVCLTDYLSDRWVEFLKAEGKYAFLSAQPTDTIIEYSIFNGLRKLTMEQRSVFPYSVYGYQYLFKGNYYILPTSDFECTYYNYLIFNESEFTKIIWWPKFYSGRKDAGVYIKSKDSNVALGVYSQNTKQKDISLIISIFETIRPK